MSSDMPSESLSILTPDPLALLSRVRQRLSQQDIAARLQVAPKTISRWENGKTDCPVYVQYALLDMLRSEKPV